MKIAPAALFLTACSVGSAQTWETFRGRITGGGGDHGKCVVEVVVDGSAEVEILAAEGRMKTLTGARATWRSMECNMGIPANPAEFKFNAVNGRGKQYIVRQPQDNRGSAVVRIEDEKGGSGTYRFEMEWRGTSGGLTAGGFGSGGSVFDPPRGPGNLPPAVPGWKEQVDFHGRGEGYYRTFRGADEVLTDSAVTIDQSGRVQVELSTKRGEKITISGRLVLADHDRLVASVAGEIQGTMEILLGSHNRVQELAMTGVGRNRFELRWRPR